MSQHQLNPNQEHPDRHQIEIEPGEKMALCRCWRSQKFPLCDGSHRQHNTENQDCIGPVVVTMSGDTEK